MKDLIERQAAIALANSLKDDLPDDERIADTVMAHNEGVLEYQTKLSLLPSAQPEMNLDEWCTDCKEYDHEKHCCPRWNRVIRQTLKDAQTEPQWIPVSEELPDMPIRVLVQLDNGWIITAYRQDNEWLSVPDFGEAIKDKWVEAWMPLPEPYREERRTE